MENKMMNTAKNMAIGMAVGAAAVTAGALYVSENKSQAKKTVHKMRRTTEKLAKAGESVVRDMIE